MCVSILQQKRGIGRLWKLSVGLRREGGMKFSAHVKGPMNIFTIMEHVNLPHSLAINVFKSVYF